MGNAYKYFMDKIIAISQSEQNKSEKYRILNITCILYELKK